MQILLIKIHPCPLVPVLAEGQRTKEQDVYREDDQQNQIECHSKRFIFRQIRAVSLY
jgi:hypothetical protein